MIDFSGKSICVAPRVGAWIETNTFNYAYHLPEVAPCVGAWIETHSHSTHRHSHSVAPRVGAWIETLHSHKGRP